MSALADHRITEPSDRAVRRSARRLMLLGKPVVPGPCWRESSSSEGDNARRGARLRARHFTEYAAELPSCATRGSERDEQESRSDRQLGRIPLLTGLGLLAQCIEGVALWLIAVVAIAVACLV